MSITATNDLFSKVFEDVKEIEFQIAWSNGAGYFDFAVYGEHAPKIPHGSVVKSMSPGGRRLLLVGTKLGNFVVYDKVMDQHPGQKRYDMAVFQYNTTSAIQKSRWFSGDVLDTYEMETALGVEGGGNLGNLIDQLASGLKRSPA